MTLSHLSILFFHLEFKVLLAASSLRALRSLPRSSSLDFGSCDNPGIVYDYGLDGTSGYSFAPENQTQFPHSGSSDIASLEVFMCDRLESSCDASSDAVSACTSAFENYSGLSGQNAADAWNEALGLYGNSPNSVATTAATVFLSESSSPSNTYSSLITTITSTLTVTQTTLFTTSETSQLTSTSQSSSASTSTLTSTSTNTTFFSESSISGSSGVGIVVPTESSTTISTTALHLSINSTQVGASGSEATRTNNGSPFGMQSGTTSVQMPVKTKAVTVFLGVALGYFFL